LPPRPFHCRSDGNKTLDELLHIHQVLGPVALQLHGDESVELVQQLVKHNITVWAACSGDTEAVRLRAMRMSEAGAEAILLDTRILSNGNTVYGGTGHTSDWTWRAN
jgi:phosphoribosylanthranilate isomerase